MNFCTCLQLKEPVEFNERVRAVKLPMSNVENGTRATVSGWGMTGKKRVRSKYLRKLSVTVYDRESCQSIVSRKSRDHRVVMHASEICGFTRNNVGYGTCFVSDAR